MNDNVMYKKLNNIIEDYGRLIYRDVERFERLIKEICGDLVKETNLILLAVKMGFAEELLNFGKREKVQPLLTDMAQRLIEAYSVDELNALKTVGLIALSLKLLVIEDYRKIIKSKEKEIQKATLDKYYIKIPVTNKNKIITIQDGIDIEMVHIKPGKFIMGSNSEGSNEKPAHKVTLTKEYWISKYPVTQKQWIAIMKHNISVSNKGGDFPVENVSWKDCLLFIQSLNNLNLVSEIFCLPTEAEWEYACRAKTSTRYYWGNEINDDFCWHLDNSNKMLHEAGKKKPNKFDIYDMCGNVWEWCWDIYGIYNGDELTDPAGEKKGAKRVIKGGSFGCPPEYCTPAQRMGINFNVSDNGFGFRLCMHAPVTKEFNDTADSNELKVKNTSAKIEEKSKKYNKLSNSEGEVDNYLEDNKNKSGCWKYPDDEPWFPEKILDMSLDQLNQKMLAFGVFFDFNRYVKDLKKSIPEKFNFDKYIKYLENYKSKNSFCSEFLYFSKMVLKKIFDRKKVIYDNKIQLKNILVRSRTRRL